MMMLMMIMMMIIMIIIMMMVMMIVSKLLVFNALMMMMMMMIIIIIIIMIIIIIIVFKGAIREFLTSLRRELSPTRTLKWSGRNRVQITCNTSGAYHVQHVVCHVVRRDSSAIKIDRV